MFSTLISSIFTITLVTLILVILLLFVKAKLTPEGTVKIDINDGKKILDVPQGGDVMHTLASQKIFLPSACGGKANCGQCNSSYRGRFLQPQANQIRLSPGLPG